MLYSYQGQFPQPLPHRIRLSNGMTRTDVTTFTPEEIADAGYIPVSNPPIPNSTEVVEWGQGQWIVRNKTAQEIAAEQQQLAQTIVETTQTRLDTFARTRNYDSILSACTYHNSPNPKFAAEAAYCSQKRSETWTILYEILAEIQAGTRPAPQSFSDIETELPVLEWPN